MQHTQCRCVRVYAPTAANEYDDYIGSDDDEDEEDEEESEDEDTDEGSEDEEGGRFGLGDAQQSLQSAPPLLVVVLQVPAVCFDRLPRRLRRRRQPQHGRGAPALSTWDSREAEAEAGPQPQAESGGAEGAGVSPWRRRYGAPAAPSARLRLVPVLFTQGVNEMQTLANTIGDTTMQAQANSESFGQLQQHLALCARYDTQRHAHDIQRLLNQQAAGQARAEGAAGDGAAGKPRSGSAQQAVVELDSGAASMPLAWVKREERMHMLMQQLEQTVRRGCGGCAVDFH
jgi:hypothetical protein